MTERLVEFLFAITNVLLGPVLIVLVLLMAVVLWMIGGLAGEAIDRARRRGPWRAFLDDLRAGRASIRDFSQFRLSGYPARIQAWHRRSDHQESNARKLLDDLELEIARRLSALSFAVRVGPMVGLVGTLLPLGPALRGLADDDLGRLASNLEVAFTTTVFGLLIGGLAHAVVVIRRNWYEQDFSDLEYVARIAVEQSGHDKPARAASEPFHA